jgi:hypothetical protein
VELIRSKATATATRRNTHSNAWDSGELWREGTPPLQSSQPTCANRHSIHHCAGKQPGAVEKCCPPTVARPSPVVRKARRGPRFFSYRNLSIGLVIHNLIFTSAPIILPNFLLVISPAAEELPRGHPTAHLIPQESGQTLRWFSENWHTVFGPRRRKSRPNESRHQSGAPAPPLSLRPDSSRATAPKDFPPGRSVALPFQSTWRFVVTTESFAPRSPNSSLLHFPWKGFHLRSSPS